jgi:hypothetical protein
MSALTVACFSWTAVTTRSLAQVGGSAAWGQGVARVFDLIDEALLVEDESLEPGRRDHWRVAIEPESVTIRTREVVRAPGAEPRVCTRLRVCTRDDMLIAELLDDEEREVAVRPLLGGVSGLHVSLAELAGGERDVRVTINGVGGETEFCVWRFAESEVAR